MTTRPPRPGGRRDALDELLLLLAEVNHEAYGLTASSYRSSPMYERMLREQEPLREAVHLHGWMRVGESGRSDPGAPGGILEEQAAVAGPLRWSRSHGDP